MITTRTAACLASEDVLAFSPASRRPGLDACGGQRIRGFRSVGGAVLRDAGLVRLHGAKVPLIDMRLRACGDGQAAEAAMVLARRDGGVVAILLDDIADLLPRCLDAPGVAQTQDSLIGVAEPGQHSMVLLAVEKLAPPVPLA